MGKLLFCSSMTQTFVFQHNSNISSAAFIKFKLLFNSNHSSFKSSSHQIKSTPSQRQPANLHPPMPTSILLLQSTDSNTPKWVSWDAFQPKGSDRSSKELEEEATAAIPSKKRSTRSARASTAKRAHVNSIPYTFEDAVEEPGPNDIAMGRGGKANNHIGNKRFRAMVKKLKPEYVRLHKEAKTEFSKHLVQMVHDEGGQFLAKDEGTGLWYPVDFKQARTKTSQALWEVNRAKREAKKKYLS